MVVRSSLLWIQVCVPKDWTKARIEDWANMASPTGISSRWTLLGAQHAAEHGYEECAQCDEHSTHHHLLLGC